uniref:26S proteasome non-ATPase regulatory subunit 1/RPN2 N-terminal domain-containing protein n=1 Tax=Glossina pallidipes TaxID=7398 RepID=A0A1B0A3S4_GLOPL
MKIAHFLNINWLAWWFQKFFIIWVRRLDALGTGKLFDVNARDEYTENIIAKCINFHVAQRVAAAENPRDAKPVDSRLKGIVNRVIQRCLEDGQYRQALGIALETRRMDIFEKSLMKSDVVAGLLAYAYNGTMSLIQNRGFRNEVLRCLVDLYLAEVLYKLTRSTQDASKLTAYQIAFDLYESATQDFLALKETAPTPTALPSTLKPQGTNAPSSKADEDKAKDALAAMGTHRQDLYEQLKFNLCQDDVGTGEAAGNGHVRLKKCQSK